ncbi:MAG: phosphotransferase [Anaerolineaceae bacterium]
MLVELVQLLAALRLPSSSTGDFEPLDGSPWAAERVSIRLPGGGERVFLLRPGADPEEAVNHRAVMEALTRSAFAAAPKLLAVCREVAVEEWVDGVSALALVPPPGAAEAAIEALAALHQLPVREGLRWEQRPADLLAEGDLPLHRLGFAAQERESAREHLAAARVEVLASPFGFVHGNAAAQNVLLGRGRAWLVDFGAAGFGAQLYDVASFLLTSGLEAPARRALAMHYARLRNCDPDKTADEVDTAGILWGIDELLRLPRRLIEMLGDDVAREALHTASARIDRGLRSPAGSSPAAAAIRAALWPA